MLILAVLAISALLATLSTARHFRRLAFERKLADTEALLANYKAAWPDLSAYQDVMRGIPNRPDAEFRQRAKPFNFSTGWVPGTWAQMVGRLNRFRPSRWLRAWRWLTCHKRRTTQLTASGFRTGDGPLKLSGMPGEWFVTNVEAGLITLERPLLRRSWRALTFAAWRERRAWARDLGRELRTFPVDLVECRNGHAIPSGTWCNQCEDRP